MSRRFHFIASDNYRPRSNVDIPSVSHLLKALKTSNKHVRANQKLLLTELHLLERVYYKGKNQHGLSLFWRSVVSTRRMASRIYEVNAPRLLEILASMFHEEAFEGAKVFSGTWTRIPPPENIAKILERLSEVATLLESANEAFLKAYRYSSGSAVAGGTFLKQQRAFCLFMPTTAFLQLTIVLMGMVSRINALASNLLDTLTQVIPRVYAVFEALEPPKPLHRRISKLSKTFLATSSVHPTDSSTAPQNTPTLPMHADDEDLGFTITRTAQPTPIEISHSMSPPLISIPGSPSITPDWLITLETVTPQSPSPPQNTLDLPSRENFPLEPEAGVKTRTVPRDASVATKKVKKRRKVRDEIDDIFG
ncbi:hypothetical protein FRC06_006958 [Ceratobasidium sp. 370]|nr:hypothetical protein FRC06_006958 [Ceratobasidium sp. 370]